MTGRALLCACVLIACGPSPRHEADGGADGSTSHACVDDCDPVQGMSCDESIGMCQGACAPQNLGKSYLGCDFYPTVTANPVDNNFHFAVAIANSTDELASITIEGGGLAAPQMFTVAPFGVEVQ